MSHTDYESSVTLSTVAQPLAVVTVWVVVFAVADVLLPSGLSTEVVTGLSGGVAFVLSRRYLDARRENES